MHVRPGFLFPGQGAQFVGMGEGLARRFEAARRVFDLADEVMGTSLTRVMWEGPEDRLRATVFTQPAILAHSLAMWAVLRDLHPEIAPSVTAGHSLGEYAALVAAGVLAPEDAFRIVRRRAELMHEASVTSPGAMAALIGLDLVQVQAVLAGVTEGVAVVANLNAPDQIVISGTRQAVDEAMARASAAGAKRVIPLAVSGAFHSPLMAGVSQGLAPLVNGVRFAPAHCPVVPNVTAVPTTDPEELRTCVLRQIESPVRWTESMEAMIRLGTTTFLELGPGRVLAGLAKRIDRSVTVHSLADPDSPLLGETPDGGSQKGDGGGT